MIKAFIFENFKGFEKTELYLEDTTILIGANASGKSNALEGIAILAELARGRNIGDILDGTRNSGGMIRGGSLGCCRQGSDSFKLGCLMDSGAKEDFIYQVTISIKPKLHIRQEVFVSVKKRKDAEEEKTLIFDTEQLPQKDLSGHSMLLTLVHLHFEAAYQKYAILPDSKITTVIGMIQSISAQFKRELTNIYLFSPNPNKMGNYSSVSDPELRIDCSNLSSALFALSKDEQKKQNLLDMIRRLSEQVIVGL